MQLQENDLDIVQMKGTDNYLADLLSRNHGGLNPRQINQTSRLTNILMTIVNLNLDPTNKPEEKKLATSQSADPHTAEITQNLYTHVTHMLTNDVLYCKCKHCPYRENTR
jgi:hypothetical protein